MRVLRVDDLLPERHELLVLVLAARVVDRTVLDKNFGHRNGVRMVWDHLPNKGRDLVVVGGAHGHVVVHLTVDGLEALVVQRIAVVRVAEEGLVLADCIIALTVAREGLRVPRAARRVPPADVGWCVKHLVRVQYRPKVGHDASLRADQLDSPGHAIVPIAVVVDLTLHGRVYLNLGGAAAARTDRSPRIQGIAEELILLLEAHVAVGAIHVGHLGLADGTAPRGIHSDGLLVLGGERPPSDIDRMIPRVSVLVDEGILHANR